jgi:predicted enzyme related to lactoylglutathione lyase
MFFGVSHLIVPVTDLERTGRLWRDVMGFAEARRGDGYVDIDSGNVVIRLIQVQAIETKVSLRLTVRDVTSAYQALLAGGGAARYEPMKTAELEEMACVTDPDGHSIVLWRHLTEDEWGFVPDLPKQGEWYPEAEHLLKRLLVHVPAMFRMLARRKTTRTIEHLAKEAKSAVTRELVIKGFITASAKINRHRLVGPLRAEGINPEDWREDFERD